MWSISKLPVRHEQTEKGGQKCFGHMDGMRRRLRGGGFDIKQSRHQNVLVLVPAVKIKLDDDLVGAGHHDIPLVFCDQYLALDAFTHGSAPCPTENKILPTGSLLQSLPSLKVHQLWV